MKRSLSSARPLAIAALVAALVVPLAASARPPGGSAAGFESQIEELGLDADTQAGVDAILDAARTQRRAVQRDLRAAHAEMGRLLEAGDTDEATLVAQAERVSALALQMQKQRIATHLELRTVLSAEQMQQLVAGMPERGSRGGPRFRGEASLRTWFTRILIREVQRHRRWQSVRKIWSTSSLSELELPATSSPIPDSALRDRLVQALERLTGRQREALVLVHLEQFTVVETAQLLGTSPGTVKTHLHRALKALRHDLADLREAEPASPGATP